MQLAGSGDRKTAPGSLCRGTAGFWGVFFYCRPYTPNLKTLLEAPEGERERERERETERDRERERERVSDREKAAETLSP